MMTCKKWLAPTALGTLLALGFVGCGSDENATETITPYERVAVIPGTWADVLTVADEIASYVDVTDESTALGYPTNWNVATADLNIPGLSGGTLPSLHCRLALRTPL
ncbi:MAG: hypothetical protein IE886_03745 [Campylobacterales bacterium]|nr:hypothetical protein [Campylobacterales bacterium]